ncbi:MAG TPA: HAD-IIIA family hydrolase, partial [Gammaproteobacteria bacterium]|nr:HAD-IIIA family hydrolase [Gammaproteobacteria bacterium]
SLDAIARLARAGFTVTVASNQAGLGRGLFDMTALEAIHQKMQTSVQAAGGTLAGIFFCPHRPEDRCDCRKPAPGLLHRIAQQFDVPLSRVPVIGDSLRDLQAAHAVGARPMLVLTGNGEQTRMQLPGELADVEVFADLAAAVTALIGTTS